MSIQLRKQKLQIRIWYSNNVFGEDIMRSVFKLPITENKKKLKKYNRRIVTIDKWYMPE